MKETKDEERPARITHAVGKKALAAQCADPNSGHMLLVTQKKEGTGCPGRSKCWASEDRRDELCVTREDVRDEFSKIHGDQGDYLSKTREGQRKIVKFEKTDSIRNRSERRANDMRKRTK